MEKSKKEQRVLDLLTSYLDDDVRHKEYKKVLKKMIEHAIYEFLDQVYNDHDKMNCEYVKKFTDEYVEKISTQT